MQKTRKHRGRRCIIVDRVITLHTSLHGRKVFPVSERLKESICSTYDWFSIKLVCRLTQVASNRCECGRRGQKQGQGRSQTGEDQPVCTNTGIPGDCQIGTFVFRGKPLILRVVIHNEMSRIVLVSSTTAFVKFY